MVPLCIFLLLLNEICQMAAVNKTSCLTQDRGVITAEVGDDVTLECFCQDDAVTYLSWYQQRLGGKPVLISTRMAHTEATISPEYKERFRVLAKAQQRITLINHLIIKDIRVSDSATYYCGVLEFNAIEFGQGAFVHVKASKSNVHTIVQQPAFVLLPLGESVNLSCAVSAEQCAGEMSLYWFRHGASQPVIVYPSEGRCENLSNEEPRMKNCTLNLALRSVSPPDAGMYYCALASCGEIVFGNGTEVEILGTSTNPPPPLVFCLIVALAVSIIVLLLLAFIMYKLKKKLCSICKGSVSHPACSAASDALVGEIKNQDADIHYAALNLNRTSERFRQEDNVCVYSRVKSRKE